MMKLTKHTEVGHSYDDYQGINLKDLFPDVVKQILENQEIVERLKEKIEIGKKYELDMGLDVLEEKVTKLLQSILKGDKE